MKIYVYWNRNNNDCVKIFHFMSPNDKYSIVETLCQNNCLNIDRKYQDYDDCEQVLREIKKNELIIFLTHGTEDEILKYRNKPERAFSDFVLINKDNVSILKDKIVLAFCCSSAKNLGRLSVSKEVGCRAFVGFEKDIVYDNGKAENSRHLIYESYKIAFMKSIKYAVQTQCNIDDYRIKLTQYMRKEAATAILRSNNHSLNTMYSATIDGLIALGDLSQPLFSSVNDNGHIE